MNANKATANQNPNSAMDNLQSARDLTLPGREAMLQRAPSASQFWFKNKEILSNAWKEWEMQRQAPAFSPDDSLLEPRLREAVETAWREPGKESIVRELWQKVSPGVYYGQFFDVNKLSQLRAYLEEVADSGIPFRPPYGIALNRRGAMLDKRSEGHWGAPSFQLFYQMLLDKYMRPIARMLLPEIVGYDSQTFGFSIQYQAGIDTSLQPHTDASAATLNINMNLPNEVFTGSEVDFYTEVAGKVNRLSFEPGTAMLHRGNVPHAARPITSGERSNLVLWLYGEQMQIPRRGSKGAAINANTSAEERWVNPMSKPDSYAPF